MFFHTQVTTNQRNAGHKSLKCYVISVHVTFSGRISYVSLVREIKIERKEIHLQLRLLSCMELNNHYPRHNEVLTHSKHSNLVLGEEITTDEYNILHFSMVPLFSFTHRAACSCGLAAAILLVSHSLRFSCMSSAANDCKKKRTMMISVKNRSKLLIYFSLYFRLIS